MSKTDFGVDQSEFKRRLESGRMTEAELTALEPSNFFIENGKIKMLLQGKKTKQDITIIDSINCTFSKDSVTVPYNHKTSHLLDNDQLRLEEDKQLFNNYIIELSKQLQQIFGYGITSERTGGIHFYNRSFILGDNYGYIGIGGQNNTVLISLTGVGCNQASDKWEERLHKFLNNAIQPSITRIDIAHDDYAAERFNVNDAIKQYHLGGFTCYRKPPRISQVGNFETEDTLGRTIYIGSRDSDKYLRIYEKGKQLQSQDYPNWVRCEIEFHNHDTIIPLDALLNPHQYFAHAYPVFNQLNTITKRIETIQHEVKADIEHRVKHAKRQTGGVIQLLKQLGYTSQQIIETLEKPKVPRKFQQRFLDNEYESIHESHAQVLSEPT